MSFGFLVFIFLHIIVVVERMGRVWKGLCYKMQKLIGSNAK